MFVLPRPSRTSVTHTRRPHVRVNTQTLCPPKNDRRVEPPPTHRLRGFEQLEDRTVPSTVFTDTYTLSMSSVPNAATVAVTVDDNVPGHDGKYKWTYHVTNTGFVPYADIGMFTVRVGDPAEVSEQDNNAGWDGYVGSLAEESNLAVWQGGEFGDLLAVDESADFWFYTDPTAIVLSNGSVWDSGYSVTAQNPIAAPSNEIVINAEEDVFQTEENPGSCDGTQITGLKIAGIQVTTTTAIYYELYDQFASDSVAMEILDKSMEWNGPNPLTFATKDDFLKDVNLRKSIIGASQTAITDLSFSDTCLASATGSTN